MSILRIPSPALLGRIACKTAMPVLVLAVYSSATADIVGDLQSRGLPVTSAFLGDTALVITMDGSLAEGDTLLKRYGGVFFALLDSVGSGWPIVGLCVEIPGSRLRLIQADLYEAIVQIREGTPDDRIALWVLEHTRVFRTGDGTASP